MIHPQIRSNLNGVNCKCTLYSLYIYSIHIEGSLAKQMKELTDINMEYIYINMYHTMYIHRETNICVQVVHVQQK